MDEGQTFKIMGFQWDRSLGPADVSVHSIERVAFRLHKALPEFV